MTVHQSSANADDGGTLRVRLRRYAPIAVIVLAMVAVFATGAHRHISLETLVRHRMAIDAQGLVYVGDRQNNRVQVFDGEGNFKTQFVNVGAPSAICITPGPRQFLYASNSNPSTSMDNGEIYKMTLDGKIVGKFGTAGKLIKEFGSVHEMDCKSENESYVGEITNWRVQKLTLRVGK
jgi:hypothetical protein